MAALAEALRAVHGDTKSVKRAVARSLNRIRLQAEERVLSHASHRLYNSLTSPVAASPEFSLEAQGTVQDADKAVARALDGLAPAGSTVPLLAAEGEDTPFHRELLRRFFHSRESALPNKVPFPPVFADLLASQTMAASQPPCHDPPSFVSFLLQDNIDRYAELALLERRILFRCLLTTSLATPRGMKQSQLLHAEITRHKRATISLLIRLLSIVVRAHLRPPDALLRQAFATVEEADICFEHKETLMAALSHSRFVGEFDTAVDAAGAREYTKRLGTDGAGSAYASAGLFTPELTACFNAVDAWVTTEDAKASLRRSAPRFSVIEDLLPSIRWVGHTHKEHILLDSTIHASRAGHSSQDFGDLTLRLLRRHAAANRMNVLLGNLGVSSADDVLHGGMNACGTAGKNDDIVDQGTDQNDHRSHTLSASDTSFLSYPPSTYPRNTEEILGHVLALGDLSRLGVHQQFNYLSFAEGGSSQAGEEAPYSRSGGSSDENPSACTTADALLRGIHRAMQDLSKVYGRDMETGGAADRFLYYAQSAYSNLYSLLPDFAGVGYAVADIHEAATRASLSSGGETATPKTVPYSGSLQPEPSVYILDTSASLALKNPRTGNVVAFIAPPHARPRRSYAFYDSPQVQRSDYLDPGLDYTLPMGINTGVSSNSCTTDCLGPNSRSVFSGVSASSVVGLGSLDPESGKGAPSSAPAGPMHPLSPDIVLGDVLRVSPAVHNLQDYVARFRDTLSSAELKALSDSQPAAKEGPPQDQRPSFLWRDAIKNYHRMFCGATGGLSDDLGATTRSASEDFHYLTTSGELIMVKLDLRTSIYLGILASATVRERLSVSAKLIETDIEHGLACARGADSASDAPSVATNTAVERSFRNTSLLSGLMYLRFVQSSVYWSEMVLQLTKLQALLSNADVLLDFLSGDVSRLTDFEFVHEQDIASDEIAKLTPNEEKEQSSVNALAAENNAYNEELSKLLSIDAFGYTDSVFKDDVILGTPAAASKGTAPDDFLMGSNTVAKRTLAGEAARPPSKLGQLRSRPSSALPAGRASKDTAKAAITTPFTYADLLQPSSSYTDAMRISRLWSALTYINSVSTVHDDLAPVKPRGEQHTETVDVSVESSLRANEARLPIDVLSDLFIIQPTAVFSPGRKSVVFQSAIDDVSAIFRDIHIAITHYANSIVQRVRRVAMIIYAERSTSLTLLAQRTKAQDGYAASKEARPLTAGEMRRSVAEHSVSRLDALYMMTDDELYSVLADPEQKIIDSLSIDSVVDVSGVLNTVLRAEVDLLNAKVDTCGILFESLLHADTLQKAREIRQVLYNLAVRRPKDWIHYGSSRNIEDLSLERKLSSRISGTSENAQGRRPDLSPIELACLFARDIPHIAFPLKAEADSLHYMCKILNTLIDRELKAYRSVAHDTTFVSISDASSVGARYDRARDGYHLFPLGALPTTICSPDGREETGALSVVSPVDPRRVHYIGEYCPQISNLYKVVLHLNAAAAELYAASVSEANLKLYTSIDPQTQRSFTYPMYLRRLHFTTLLSVMKTALLVHAGNMRKLRTTGSVLPRHLLSMADYGLLQSAPMLGQVVERCMALKQAEVDATLPNATGSEKTFVAERMLASLFGLLLPPSGGILHRDEHNDPVFGALAGIYGRSVSVKDVYTQLDRSSRAQANNFVSKCGMRVWEGFPLERLPFTFAILASTLNLLAYKKLLRLAMHEGQCLRTAEIAQAEMCTGCRAPERLSLPPRLYDSQGQAAASGLSLRDHRAVYLYPRCMLAQSSYGDNPPYIRLRSADGNGNGNGAAAVRGPDRTLGNPECGPLGYKELLGHRALTNDLPFLLTVDVEACNIMHTLSFYRPEDAVRAIMSEDFALDYLSCERPSSTQGDCAREVLRNIALDNSKDSPLITEFSSGLVGIIGRGAAVEVYVNSYRTAVVNYNSASTDFVFFGKVVGGQGYDPFARHAELFEQGLSAGARDPILHLFYLQNGLFFNNVTRTGDLLEITAANYHLRNMHRLGGASLPPAPALALALTPGLGPARAQMQAQMQAGAPPGACEGSLEPALYGGDILSTDHRVVLGSSGRLRNHIYDADTPYECDQRSVAGLSNQYYLCSEDYLHALAGLAEREYHSKLRAVHRDDLSRATLMAVRQSVHSTIMHAALAETRAAALRAQIRGLLAALRTMLAETDHDKSLLVLETAPVFRGCTSTAKDVLAYESPFSPEGYLESPLAVVHPVAFKMVHSTASVLELTLFYLVCVESVVRNAVVRTALAGSALEDTGGVLSGELRFVVDILGVELAVADGRLGTPRALRVTVPSTTFLTDAEVALLQRSVDVAAEKAAGASSTFGAGASGAGAAAATAARLYDEARPSFEYCRADILLRKMVDLRDRNELGLLAGLVQAQNNAARGGLAGAEAVYARVVRTQATRLNTPLGLEGVSLDVHPSALYRSYALHSRARTVRENAARSPFVLGPDAVLPPSAAIQRAIDEKNAEKDASSAPPTARTRRPSVPPAAELSAGTMFAPGESSPYAYRFSAVNASLDPPHNAVLMHNRRNRFLSCSTAGGGGAGGGDADAGQKTFIIDDMGRRVDLRKAVPENLDSTTPLAATLLRDADWWIGSVLGVHTGRAALLAVPSVSLLGAGAGTGTGPAAGGRFGPNMTLDFIARLKLGINDWGQGERVHLAADTLASVYRPALASEQPPLGAPGGGSSSDGDGGGDAPFGESRMFCYSQASAKALLHHNYVAVANAPTASALALEFLVRGSGLNGATSPYTPFGLSFASTLLQAGTTSSPYGGVEAAAGAVAAYAPLPMFLPGAVSGTEAGLSAALRSLELDTLIIGNSLRNTTTLLSSKGSAHDAQDARGVRDAQDMQDMQDPPADRSSWGTRRVCLVLASGIVQQDRLERVFLRVHGVDPGRKSSSLLSPVALFGAERARDILRSGLVGQLLATRARELRLSVNKTVFQRDTGPSATTLKLREMLTYLMVPLFLYLDERAGTPVMLDADTHALSAVVPVLRAALCEALGGQLAAMLYRQLWRRLGGLEIHHRELLKLNLASGIPSNSFLTLTSIANHYLSFLNTLGEGARFAGMLGAVTRERDVSFAPFGAGGLASRGAVLPPAVLQSLGVAEGLYSLQESLSEKAVLEAAADGAGRRATTLDGMPLSTRLASAKAVVQLLHTGLFLLAEHAAKGRVIVGGYESNKGRPRRPLRFNEAVVLRRYTAMLLDGLQNYLACRLVNRLARDLHECEVQNPHTHLLSLYQVYDAIQESGLQYAIGAPEQGGQRERFRLTLQMYRAEDLRGRFAAAAKDMAETVGFLGHLYDVFLSKRVDAVRGGCLCRANKSICSGLLRRQALGDEANHRALCALNPAAAPFTDSLLRRQHELFAECRQSMLAERYLCAAIHTEFGRRLLLLYDSTRIARRQHYVLRGRKEEIICRSVSLTRAQYRPLLSLLDRSGRLRDGADATADAEARRLQPYDRDVICEYDAHIGRLSEMLGNVQLRLLLARSFGNLRVVTLRAKQAGLGSGIAGKMCEMGRRIWTLVAQLSDTSKSLGRRISVMQALIRDKTSQLVDTRQVLTHLTISASSKAAPRIAGEDVGGGPEATRDGAEEPRDKAALLQMKAGEVLNAGVYTTIANKVLPSLRKGASRLATRAISSAESDLVELKKLSLERDRLFLERKTLGAAALQARKQGALVEADLRKRIAREREVIAQAERRCTELSAGLRDAQTRYNTVRQNTDTIGDGVGELEKARMAGEVDAAIAAIQMWEGKIRDLQQKYPEVFSSGPDIAA